MGRPQAEEEPLDLMVRAVAEVDPSVDVVAWRELADVLDAAGVLDGLDHHDARRVVGVALVHLHDNGIPQAVQRLQQSADWMAGGGVELHDRPASAAALRRIAGLVEL